MQFRRRLSPEARVDLIPMIDVVFQLVIFFMVTSTFMMTPGINLVFPKSTTTEPVIMSNIVVTVAAPDEIYLNRDKYSLSSFEEALANIDEQERQDIESILLEIDERVPFATVISVMDQLRLYGFANLSFKVLEDNSPRTP